MAIRFGRRDVEATDLDELRDSSGLLGDVAALRARMEEDGYLLLRGLLDRQAVLRARQRILEYMAEQEALVPGTPVLEGVMANSAVHVQMMGRKGITHCPEVRAVLESRAMFEFYESFFNEPALTFDYKWLRGVGHEEYTSAHMDIVYMGRGSNRLFTCWVPFGDIPIEQGTLAMVPGSHRSPAFERMRQTYGRMDVDRDRIEGWFTKDPLEITEKFGGRWATTNFRAGDVITFGMYLVHASTTNTTPRYRISCDVRYQPAADPVDDRWCGENPRGHYAWMTEPEKVIPIAAARAAWGI
jgi:ectoine hydroxylase-related dioxygenase (phytanoyl-CoA dioxygenase family)